ncbi:MAG: hypothetical protein A4E68_00006 [Syntrophaceae bacterium PtaB.Bin095]|nr:MAG: hypothetical protein A4E68_00006 [Syntrophaceae bacterium PtaB.Bin095]
MRNRVFLALVIAATLIGLIGLLRPDAMRTVSREKWFWTWKTHSKNTYDIVVLGDSRVYRGVSPETMKDVLPGYRIFNLGYSSGSLSPLMLAESIKRLNKEGKRIVILGITPHAMTPKAALDEQFRQEKNRTASEILENIYLAPFLGYFDPTTPIKFLEDIRGKNKDYREEIYESGWIATSMNPLSPPEAIGRYEQIFADNRVSPVLVDNIMRQTETWSRERIRVFAFRPPTSPEMVDLESRLSGFDEEEFRQHFIRAGGIWIDVNQPGYRSYDHSHLDRDSAEALSRLIAQAVVQALGEQVPSPAQGSVSRSAARPGGS